MSTFQNFGNAETQKFQACFLKLKLLIYAIFIILGKQNIAKPLILQQEPALRIVKL